jgi:N-methylhydantoinase A/oxoprolinase/acetone carboxylase beta subunit
VSSPLRIGVDVGGTFTKAVAIRPSPFAILAQAIVPTTHGSTDGVARGVVEALSLLLAKPEVHGQPIAAVSHSTTQAVNALLEGDVVKVGIVGIGPAEDAAQLRKLTTPGNIPLAPGRFLPTVTRWLDSPVTAERAAAVVDQLIVDGIGAVVASGAYSVDDASDELLVMAAASTRGLPAVGGHEVSSAYGLEIRTITASVNASILPKMTQTVDQVEACLRLEGIHAPLLIMRGDGGLSDAAGLRKRPILSLLSGPAASVAGALLSGRVLDGVFIEVGGTSTNLAVIQDGQPALRYVQIMDRPTAIRSLDVRVQGVAGGSLVRIKGRQLTDVGPRSAHIAGLPYLSFSAPVGDLQIELIAPRPGDPADYAIVRDSTGSRYALTVTCAANALGTVPGDAYASAQRDTALRGFAALGATIGLTAEKTAERMIELASKRVADAVQRLAREYKLKQITLIGGGGGAGALVPAVAARLHVSHHLAEHAEVISSIGVALALVREEVERGSAGTTPEAVAQEAIERAVAAGAAPDTVQVVTELIPERAMIRAIASGALVLDGHDGGENDAQKTLSADELRQVAARRAESETDQVEPVGATGRFHIFHVTPKRNLFRRGWSGVIAVDVGGAVRLTAQHATAACGTGAQALQFVRDKVKGTSLPHVTIIAANRLIRLPETSDAKELLAAAESALLGTESTVIAVCEPVAWL